jgi:hypothetical protein
MSSHRPRHITLAALFVCGALLARSGAALAGPPAAPAAPLEAGTFVLSLASVGVPLAFGAAAGLLNGNMTHDRPSWGKAFIVGGGAGIGLGIAATVLQSREAGSCQQDCVTTYTFAGVGMALGVVLASIGVYLVVPPRSGVSMRLVPTPLVLRTDRAVVPGAGLAAISF